MKRFKLVFTTTILFLLLLAHCEENETTADTESETIKIGFLHNFSNTTDKSRLNTLLMAVEEVNNNGDIFGRKIELVYQDTQGDTNVIKQKATQMIADGIVAILGLNGSTQTLVMSKAVTIPAGIVHIGHLQTSASISSLNDQNLVWRTCPSDAFQGNIAAKYVVDTWNPTNVAVIYVNDTYGKGLANVFKTKITELGKTVNTFKSFESSATNFDNTFLTEVFSKKPDLIYVVGEAAITATFTVNAQVYLTDNPQNIPHIMGCDATYNSGVFLPNADKNFSVGMRGTKPSIKKDALNYATFVANFKAKYGTEPTATACAEIYDAFYLIVYAMLKAGEKTFESKDNKQISQAIAQNLKRISGGDQTYQGPTINVNEFSKAKTILPSGEINYDGASGNVDLDENGDIKSGYYELWEVVKSGNELKFETKTYIQYP